MNHEDELLGAVAGLSTILRDLADSLQSMTVTLAKLKDAGCTEQELEPKGSEKSKKEKNEVYTLEDVRGVLAEKSQSGLTADVKKLIIKYGGSKLSDIDPSKYADIIKEAEVLGNG